MREKRRNSKKYFTEQATFSFACTPAMYDTQGIIILIISCWFLRRNFWMSSARFDCAWKFFFATQPISREKSFFFLEVLGGDCFNSAARRNRGTNANLLEISLLYRKNRIGSVEILCLYNLKLGKYIREKKMNKKKFQDVENFPYPCTPFTYHNSVLRRHWMQWGILFWD